MKRWILRGILFVVVLIMSLISVATVLIATEPGTRWLLDEAKALTGARFTYRDGTLLNGVQLSDLHYQAGVVDVQLQSVSVRWHPAGAIWGLLLVDYLHLDGLTVELTPAADKEQDSAEDFAWPDLGIPLVVRVGDLKLRRALLVQGDHRYRLESLTGGLSYGPRALTLDEVQAQSAGQTAQLSGDIALAYPYDLQATLAVAMVPRPDTAAPDDISRFIPDVLIDRDLNGELEAKGDLTALDFSLALAAPAELEAEGRWSTGVEGEPALEAQIDAPPQALANYWLDMPAVAGMTAGGRLSLEGWIDDYRAVFVGDYQAQGYPGLVLELEASGDTDHLQLSRILLGADQAELEGTGELVWREGLSWHLDAQAEGVNPAVLVSDWPGNLRGQFRSRGQFKDGELELDTALHSLDGTLRSLAVAGSGEVNYRPEEMRFTDLSLSIGANQAHIDGRLGERFDIDWSVRAPLLEQIDPAIGGQLVVEGQLKGSRDDPQLTGSASGTNLRWQDYSAAQLSVKSELVNLANRQLLLAAEAADLQLAGRALASAELTFNGNPGQHNVSLALEQDERTQLSLDAAGGWDGERWDGALGSLQLRSGYSRPLSLADAAELTLAADRVALSGACLVTEQRRTDTQLQAKLCGEGHWDRENGAEAAFSVERLPLALLRRWLKEEVDVEGYLQGGGELSWVPGRSPVISADLQAVDGAFIHQVSEEESDRYPVSALTLSMSQKDGQLQARSRLAFEGYGEVNAQLQAGAGGENLRGEVVAALDNLSPLEALLPAVRDITGSLTANADIAGSLAQPQLTVDARLSDGAFDLPSLGVSLSGLNARAQGNQQALEVTANAKAGEGNLDLVVNATDLVGDNWQVIAEIDGEQAHVMNIPALNLWVTPDVTVEASTSGIKIRGSTRVPKAHAVINTLPVSATQTSDDVVVIDADTSASGNGRLPVYMDLDIVLGDEVTFDAAGFKARLGGDLSIDKSPSRAIYAVGSINIIDGRFQAYGQDLTIERGTLSFQGPLDDPGLNVTATREVDDVQVGLIIGGTLQKPVTEIYSRPQQTESNAMSMLFTGKPLDGASSGEASMLVNAIAKLGIKRGQFLADDIAGRFGLDELTIKSEDDVKDSRLWLGKYLTEDLYVHYAIGLFDSISTVGVTYFISDNLRLEAESGEVQSADLIFRMER